MNKTIRALQARKAAAVDAAKALNAKAGAEDRDFTAEEQAEYDGYMAEATSLENRIAREISLAEAQVAAGDALGVQVDENVAADPKRGFKSYGDFAQTVRAAARPGVQPDQRLLIGAAAPTTFGNESNGADGGFLVPPEFARDIWTLSLAGDETFLPMTDNVPVEGNSMTFPKDETTPWGTDGIRAYWQAEAAAATATKPVLGNSTQRLHKLMALVPVTDELLGDTSALAGYLPRKTGDSIRWKTNEAFVRGTGDGQPLGFLNSGALVSVAKETGQAAGTLNVQNIAKMFSRMLPSALARSVWLINSDVLPQLLTMTLGNYPIYTPPQTGVVNAPAGLLFGRPIIITQHSDTVGSVGDIMFVDWKHYRTITKSNGGIETATSMHLYFDAAATAFRALFRVDGAPALTKPITQAKGSNNLSPFVALAARA